MVNHLDWNVTDSLKSATVKAASGLLIEGIHSRRREQAFFRNTFALMSFPKSRRRVAFKLVVRAISGLKVSDAYCHIESAWSICILRTNKQSLTYNKTIEAYRASSYRWARTICAATRWQISAVLWWWLPIVEIYESKAFWSSSNASASRPWASRRRARAWSIRPGLSRHMSKLSCPCLDIDNYLYDSVSILPNNCSLLFRVPVRSSSALSRKPCCI